MLCNNSSDKSDDEQRNNDTQRDDNYRHFEDLECDKKRAELCCKQTILISHLTRVSILQNTTVKAKDQTKETKILHQDSQVQGVNKTKWNCC